MGTAVPQNCGKGLKNRGQAPKQYLAPRKLSALVQLSQSFMIAVISESTSPWWAGIRNPIIIPLNFALN